jgi:hypothetical protein
MCDEVLVVEQPASVRFHLHERRGVRNGGLPSFPLKQWSI